jgi:hypothetical protein
MQLLETEHGDSIDPTETTDAVKDNVEGGVYVHVHVNAHVT